MTDRLTVTEIYASIQGESSYAGFPCTFIRLAGCPLRCRWCDTAYSFGGGRSMDHAEILQEVEKAGIKLVELTGGEPLAQAGTPALIATLVGLGYKVLIETSGAEPIETLHPETHVIMDLKCPDSGMAERNRWENLAHLKPTDEIKFVLASRGDFDWAVEMVKMHRLEGRVRLLFSCAWGQVAPKDLAAWMVAMPLVDARLQLQQHKYIWSPRAKGV